MNEILRQTLDSDLYAVFVKALEKPVFEPLVVSQLLTIQQMRFDGNAEETTPEAPDEVEDDTAVVPEAAQDL